MKSPLHQRVRKLELLVAPDETAVTEFTRALQDIERGKIGQSGSGRPYPHLARVFQIIRERRACQA